MVLIRCSACEYTMFSSCMVAARGDNPIYPFVVHTELSRFLNCRTVVASVELSFADALLSKRRPKVHKSRVSLSYSRIYIYILWSCNKNIIGIYLTRCSRELTSL